MRKWFVGSLFVVLLVSVAPVLAAETNVYGDPGSGSFSAAMAVTADETGAIFTMGVFFGEFQGISSTGWDVWMARIDPSGGFDWLVTWDATEIDDTDFSQDNLDSAAWTNPGVELVVGDGNRLIGSVTTAGATTVVGASAGGENPSHHVLYLNLESDSLVGDGATGLIGWGNDLGVSGVTRVDVDGVERWFTPLGGGRPGPLLLLPDGTMVAGVSLDRLGFQKPAVKVIGLSGQGTIIWETEVFDACFQGGNALVQLGNDVGVLLEPPQVAYPSLCDPDMEMVATLDAASGVRTAQRTLKDTMNIIWCDDPRLGPISDSFGFGFVDGDECDGSDVFWTNVNYPLLGEGSEVEAFAIMGMEIVGQGPFGYGVVRSRVENDRWILDEFEYFAPASGMMPYGMVLTDSGPVVVGRAFNTAWIETGQANSGPLVAASSQPGAATLITSTLLPSGRFLDDNASVFEADIEWLDSEGITRGCNPPDNSLFCPDSAVTRGQMAAFLHRALDGVVVPIGDPIDFTDDDVSRFTADIAWLSATGITKGCGTDTFCPVDPVTRGQMAAFLVRALGYADDGGGNLFVDDDDSIFEDQIDRLATANVTKGCNPPVNDQFCPNSFVTRGQMAAFLHRALG